MSQYDPDPKEPWIARAECAKSWDDPQLSGGWDTMQHQSVYQAISICKTCPVKRECAIDALRDPAAQGIRAGYHFNRGRVEAGDRRRLLLELDITKDRRRETTYDRAPREAL